MSEPDFLAFLFKNTESKLREAYVAWLLTTDCLPPENEDGFLWWLSHRESEAPSSVVENE